MRAIAWCLGLLAVAWGPAATARGQTYTNFFASKVVQYSPGPGNSVFPDPVYALGGPRGNINGAASNLVTLGVQGSLTLGFSGDGTDCVIADGPGGDFIVFENPIQAGPGAVFGELIRVQVSTDGVHFVEFPTTCDLTAPLLETLPFDPTKVSGFAGVHPVLANVATNQISPYNPAVAGGDAFDLNDLRNLPDAVSGLVNINRIRYVRLVDVLGAETVMDDEGWPTGQVITHEWDSRGHAIYDPTAIYDAPVDTEDPFGPHVTIGSSADVDALAVIHGLVNPDASQGPMAGDADRDGLVGMADYFALKANFGHGPGATWEQGDFNKDGYVNRLDMAIMEGNFGTSGVAPAGASPVPEPCAAALLAAGWAVLAGVRRKRAMA